MSINDNFWNGNIDMTKTYISDHTNASNSNRPSFSLTYEELLKMFKPDDTTKPGKDSRDLTFENEVLTRQLRQAQSDIESLQRRVAAAESRVLTERTERVLAQQMMTAATELLQHLSKESVANINEAIDLIQKAAEDRESRRGRFFFDHSNESVPRSGITGGVIRTSNSSASSSTINLTGVNWA